MLPAARSALAVALPAAVALALLPACRGAGGTQANTTVEHPTGDRATADRATVRRIVAVRTVTGEHVPARVRFDAAGPWHAIDAYGGRALDLPEGLVPAAVEVDGERVARVLTSDDAWLVLLENAPVTMTFQLDDGLLDLVGRPSAVELQAMRWQDHHLVPLRQVLGTAPVEADGSARVVVPPDRLTYAFVRSAGGQLVPIDVDSGLDDARLDHQPSMFVWMRTRATPEPIVARIHGERRADLRHEVRVVDADGRPVAGARIDRLAPLAASDGGAELVAQGPAAVTDAEGVASVVDPQEPGASVRYLFSSVRVRVGDATWLLPETIEAVDTLVVGDDPFASRATFELVHDEPMEVTIVAAREGRPVVDGVGRMSPRRVERGRSVRLPVGCAALVRTRDGDRSLEALVSTQGPSSDGPVHLTSGLVPRSLASAAPANVPHLPIEGLVEVQHEADGVALRLAWTVSTALGESIEVAVPASDPTAEVALWNVDTPGSRTIRTIYGGSQVEGGEDPSTPLDLPLSVTEVRVVGPDGEPLPFAPVWVDSQVGDPSLPAFTDANGRLLLLVRGREGELWLGAMTRWTFDPRFPREAPVEPWLAMLERGGSVTLHAAPHTR